MTKDNFGPIEKAPEAAAPTAPLKVEKRADGRISVCQVEIFKDGHVFIARTQTEVGEKEYRNTVFEDLLTEMVITIQEQLIDQA